MKLLKCIHQFEKNILKKQIPILQVGNKIRIGTQIREAEKIRVQYFEGIIILKRNSSTDTTITVRRIFQGIGVERTFPIYSPQILSIIILNPIKAKRAKLFYLRNRVGKAATRVQKKRRIFQA